MLHLRAGRRIVLLAVCVAAAASAASSRLRILDKSGNPVAARVRLRDRQGRLLPVPAAGTPAPLLAHPRFPDLGVIVEGELNFEVPAGPSHLEIDRGSEYLPLSVEIGPGAPSEVRLERWIDMPARGWWPADLHVHRDPADMPLLLKASGLNFAPDITRWNQNSNLAKWPERPTVAVAPSTAYSVDNAEDERPWGAALFLGLKTPISLYHAKTEWPPALETWKEARARGAFIDQEKIIWWAAPVIAALIRPDTIGVANNHFLEEGLLDSEAWGRPRDRDKYPGPSGFANYIFDLYYTWLSAGFRIPASAGSANGVLKNPLGYSRSYAYLEGAFTPQAWLAAQKAGRNFVTNGPMLFLTADDQLPGAVLARDVKSANIDLSAISSARLERLDLIVNGAVVQSFRPGPDASRIAARFTLKLSPADWIAARCFEANARTIRFAHTSPIYVGSEPRRDPAALAFLREWIDRYVEQVSALPAESLNADQKQQWLALCRKARDTYR